MNTLSRRQGAVAATAMSRLAELRVASEWGIGGICQCWNILKRPVPADDPISGSMRWELGVRLYNIRCRLLSVCQIRRVFWE